jgi:hypothetical protein
MGQIEDSPGPFSTSPSLFPAHVFLRFAIPAQSRSPSAAATRCALISLAARRLAAPPATSHQPPQVRSASYSLRGPQESCRGEEGAPTPRKMGWKAAEKLIRHWKILRGDNVSWVVLHSIPLLSATLFSLRDLHVLRLLFWLPGDDHQRQGQGGVRAHQAGHSLAESRHRRGQELGNVLLHVRSQLFSPSVESM